NSFAELLLRLRPIGLALRATPAAPFRNGSIFIYGASIPLLCEEENTPHSTFLLRINETRATRASQQMCTLPSPPVRASCHHEIKILLAPHNSVSNLHGRCLCNRVWPPGTHAGVQHHAHRPVDDPVRCSCPHAGSRLPDCSIAEGRCDI